MRERENIRSMVLERANKGPSRLSKHLQKGLPAGAILQFEICVKPTAALFREFVYNLDHRLASQINPTTEKLTRANIYAGGEHLAEDAPDAA